MSLFEIVFRTKYDNPFGNVTDRYPSMRLYQWCNGQYDIIELVLQKQDDYALVGEDLAKVVDVVEEIHSGGNTHVITRSCACCGPGTVGKYLDDPSILNIPPVAYEGGWEYYRLIAFRHENVRRLLARLHQDGYNVEILRKTPFDGYIASSLTLTTDALFSGITEKQMDALLVAYAQGYFRYPRGADLQTIASRQKMGRTTFLEHLKKAENKLITALIPHIQLFRQLPQERRRTMGFARDAG